MRVVKCETETGRKSKVQLRKGQLKAGSSERFLGSFRGGGSLVLEVNQMWPMAVTIASRFEVWMGKSGWLPRANGFAAHKIACPNRIIRAKG